MGDVRDAARVAGADPRARTGIRRGYQRRVFVASRLDCTRAITFRAAHPASINISGRISIRRIGGASAGSVSNFRAEARDSPQA